MSAPIPPYYDTSIHGPYGTHLPGVPSSVLSTLNDLDGELQGIVDNNVLLGYLDGLDVSLNNVATITNDTNDNLTTFISTTFPDFNLTINDISGNVNILKNRLIQPLDNLITRVGTNLTFTPQTGPSISSQTGNIWSDIFLIQSTVDNISQNVETQANNISDILNGLGVSAGSTIAGKLDNIKSNINALPANATFILTITTGAISLVALAVGVATLIEVYKKK